MADRRDGTDPDEFDRRRRRAMWSMPSGLYLLGSRAGDESNLMTINWVTQVASDPKLIGVSVETGAVTHRLVSEGGVFTVCILYRSDRAVVRRFVRPAERDAATGALNGFDVFAARTGAPVFAGSAAWLDCEVRHRLDLGSHTFFVGEVVDGGAPAEADAEVLRMEDTRMNYGG
ncbi:MAG: flavin reductase family protein [Actinomycetota bacterium]|nr:flavin reductase family protein [Actinomycetota bacterium]